MPRGVSLWLLALAGCWRGSASEPAERVAVRAKVPARPVAGPSLESNSPGPLATVHAAWDQEDGCLTCHVVVGTRAPLASDRCLGCHDHAELRTRTAAGLGLHARLRNACESCHHEHRGRGFDLRGWSSLPGGEAGFDHLLAGWAMPPTYQGTPCSGCHGAVDSQGLRVYHDLDRAQFP